VIGKRREAPLGPSQDLAARLGEAVEAAVEAQVPAVRLALKRALADEGARVRWGPDPRRPRRAVVSVGGHVLVEIGLVRPTLR
jgi:hypothetical protein